MGMNSKFKKSLMITGASATGKTTLIRNISKSENLKLVPDHTTRPIRPGEVNGIDKIFLSTEKFIKQFNLGWYIEPDLSFAKYNENYYGTPSSWIEDIKNKKDKLAFISVSVAIGRKIKLAVKDNVLWVHLVANENVRKMRLLKRVIGEGEMKKRLTGGDSQEKAQDADLLIDTSNISSE
ncbi:hypothetical protein KKB58_01750, partial [Patescibacteria group bacterium]|nr:hypothetical protein [Patescibacteria group bacterium]